MSEYFPEPKSLGRRIKFELDFSNYPTKPVLKTATGVDTSKFAKKVDWANLKSNSGKLDIYKLKNVLNNLSNLKSKLDNLDVDKLIPVPVDLSRLRNIVKNDVVKQMYIMLRLKVLKIKYLIAANCSHNAKLNEVKGEIPSITNLATTATLTTVENKISNVSNLVKKTD